MGLANSRIIINADDFGASSDKNAAITDCFRKKLINSTTIMVNTDGFKEAIELAHKFNFKDKIGIHLNLTHGKSLTDLSKTGLTDENGIFIRKGVSNPYIFFSAFKKSRIKIEIQQQYNRLLDSNIIPTHIDSHHHVHTIPWIAGIFIELAKIEKQKIRITNDKFKINFIKMAYDKFLNNHYRKNHINFTDKFERISTLFKYLNKLENNNLIYEIMVHPAYKNKIIIDAVDHINLEESLIHIKKYIS